jgi:two-component SAPR family response regulator
MAVTAALKTANDEVGVEAAPAATAEHELAQVHVISTTDERPSSAGFDDESRDDSRQPAPEVLVLGPVEVRFANGEDAGSARRRKLSELAAFIALHPGADNHGIDDAVWPTRRVSTSTRNSATSRLRRWLGTDPDGEPWLPLVPDRGQYRFRPGVRCDWHEFQVLTKRGLARGPGFLEHLERALSLVRGRPFAGVDPAAFTWAEYDTQEMISAITDVAHLVSAARLGAGDLEGARSAAARGLVVEPCSERLTQDAIRAANAVGDSAEAERLVERLRTRLSAIDPDAEVDAETVELARR